MTPTSLSRPIAHSHLRRFTLPIVAAGIALGLAAHAHANLVYSEAFNNTTGVNQPASSVGWEIIVGNGSDFIFPIDTGSGGISSGTSRPGIANLGQLDTSDSANNGFMFIGGNNANYTHFLASTSEYTGAIPLNKDTLISISFEQGNSANAAATFRAALQIDGDWFVSPMQTGNNVGNAAAFVAGAVKLTFDSFTGADWFSLDPSNLTIGSTAMSLPSGGVWAFGVFGTKANLDPNFTTARIDNFQVAAIPEPSTAVLLLGGVALLWVVRRRLQG